MNNALNWLPEPVAVIFTGLVWVHLIFFGLFIVVCLAAPLAMLSPLIGLVVGLYFLVRHFLRKAQTRVKKDPKLLSSAPDLTNPEEGS